MWKNPDDQASVEMQEENYIELNNFQENLPNVPQK